MRVRELRVEVEVALTLCAASFLRKGPSGDFATPGWTVLGKRLPSIGIDVYAFVVWNSLKRLFCRQPTVHLPQQSSPYRSCFGSQLLGILGTWPGHSVGGVNAGDTGPIYDLRFRNFVLLQSDVRKSAEEAQVELTELLGVSLL